MDYQGTGHSQREIAPATGGLTRESKKSEYWRIRERPITGHPVRAELFHAIQYCLPASTARLIRFRLLNVSRVTRGTEYAVFA